MIEVIYKGEHKGDNKDGTQVVLPKNIRQIGESGQDRKIYIEDYAVTYMHQLADENKEGSKRVVAVLLGEVQREGQNRYIFINGVISVEDPDFSEEMWDKVQQQMMEFFDGREIMGWYLGEGESALIVTEEMQHIHESQFPGEDQVFILRDFSEGESAVYALEHGKLAEQKGYYIYYEKNLMMQEYMVARSKERLGEEPEVKDEAVQNFRKKISEEKKEPAKQPITTKLLYAASSFLVMTVLIIGITLINNYDKMKDMEMALAGISESMGAGAEAEAQDGSTGTVSVMAPADGQGAETERMQAGEAAQKETVDSENTAAQDIGQNGESSEKETQGLGSAPKDTSAQGEDSSKDTEQAVSQNDQKESDQPQTEKKEMDPAKQPSRETVGRASYVVKVGDTLATISEMYYGTLDKVDEICSMNGITDKNTILPGQKIVLP